MQVFGNVATQPVRKVTKSGNKGYFEFRLAEATRGLDTAPTFYTARLMRDEDPLLVKGDFVKVTGKLKADFYLNREGKPTGTLLIIAFEASKIAKPTPMQDEEKSGAIAATKEQAKEKAPAPLQVRPSERMIEKAQSPVQEPQLATEQAHESDWTALYS